MYGHRSKKAIFFLIKPGLIVTCYYYQTVRIEVSFNLLIKNKGTTEIR